jgi:alkylation response protein AidB-like acyl-CoA dehydrogenase
MLCRTLRPEFGGPGDDFFSAAVVIEEIARRRLHAAAAFYLHSDVAVPYLARFGSPGQQARYLPECAAGRATVALALTEEHSGSDLRAIRTTAVRRGEHYLLNGEKTHVSGGAQASLLVVSARKPDGEGLTLLLVDASAHALERHTLPRHGLAGLETASIRFRDCRVPIGSRLGSEGMGLAYLVQMLAAERLVLAVAAQAAGRRVLGDLVRACGARSTRTGSVLAYQNTRFLLAELAAESAVNQAFVDACVAQQAGAGVRDSGAAIAKLRTTETLKRMALAAAQLRGAAGMTRVRSPVAEDLLDSCVQTIWGGPSEVMKEIIATDLDGWAEQ